MSIYTDIALERQRQNELCAAGQFPHTLDEIRTGISGFTIAGALSPAECLGVLAEEFGEVAMVVADNITGKPLDAVALRAELIQVAACAVAWVEQIDRIAAARAEARLPAPPRTPSIPNADAIAARAPSYVPRAPPRPQAALPQWLDLLPDYGGAL